MKLPEEILIAEIVALRSTLDKNAEDLWKASVKLTDLGRMKEDPSESRVLVNYASSFSRIASMFRKSLERASAMDRIYKRAQQSRLEEEEIKKRIAERKQRNSTNTAQTRSHSSLGEFESLSTSDLEDLYSLGDLPCQKISLIDRLELPSLGHL